MAKHIYDKEFREGVIQYCLDHPDESYVSISKRFGVHDTTIGGWMKSYRKNDNEIVVRGVEITQVMMQRKLLDSKKN